ncbi:MAG: Hpt domain-containing protein, partial [Bacteroidota bacterium]
MEKKEEEFLQRLQEIFHAEAVEHVNVLSSGLLEMEKNTDAQFSLPLIETIYREVHSLKGAARSVNRNDIETVCQILESTFAQVKNGTLTLSAGHFDQLHNAVDAVSKMISSPASMNSAAQKELAALLRSISERNILDGPKDESSAELHESLIQTPANAKGLSEVHAEGERSGRGETARAVTADEKLVQSETVRIQTAKLDMLFLQAEQMIQSKIASVQRTIDLKNITLFVGTWKSELRKYGSRRSGDDRAQVKELLIWTKEKLDETERTIGEVTHAIESDQRSLGRMIDDHVDSVKKVLMLPVATMLEVFPRLVRDLARTQGKEVELIIHGKEIEVDKRILEELKDPLIHLLRNCIDHGIQIPEERTKAHKPSRGTITLNFAVR